MFNALEKYSSILVLCSSLSYSNNGTINCSLGDDGVPSYEDTCSFTCNTGYELTDSGTRICQSDGSWSGSNSMCRMGKLHIRIARFSYPKDIMLISMHIMMHI